MMEEWEYVVVPTNGTWTAASLSIISMEVEALWCGEEFGSMDGKTELVNIDGISNNNKYWDLLMTAIIIPTCED